MGKDNRNNGNKNANADMDFFDKFDENDDENKIEINMDQDILFPSLFVPASNVLLVKTNLIVTLVYGKIWLLSRKLGYSFMATGTIAKQLNLSESAVKDAINILLGKDEIGSGKSKRKNKYFNSENALIADVTPENFLSKKQVRYYAPLSKRYEKFVAKYQWDNGELKNITVDQELEIQEKINRLDKISKVNGDADAVD